MLAFTFWLPRAWLLSQNITAVKHSIQIGRSASQVSRTGDYVPCTPLQEQEYTALLKGIKTYDLARRTSR